jgi:signal transduction histidine kinase
MKEFTEDNENIDPGFLMVIHQIQSPLSAVKWTLSMLLSGDMGELTKEQKAYVEKAFDSNARAIKLIRSVLSANRLDSGREIMTFDTVAILDVVNSSIYELKEVAREKGIKLSVREFEGISPLVKIDRDKMRDAFENLLDNAIKYTPKGGIILVGVKNEEHDVLITVEDNGMGISEEDESSIFLRYYRGKDKKVVGTTGTGLGLYISKNIIEKHGGKIWFEDKKRDLHLEESGVKFSFTIPLHNI